MTNVTLTEVARNLSDYINRVVYKHERFVLTRGHRPVAELSPVPSGRTLSELSGVLESRPHLSADDAKAFGCDIENSRDTLSAPGSPWES